VTGETGVEMVVGGAPPMRNESHFVGRHAEAALVGVTLDQSSPGAPAAIVVRGEPGIGKTRLLREAVARAEAKGHHVLWVRANPLEAQVPFGALSVALDRAAATDPAFVPGATAMREFIGGAGSDHTQRLSFAQICDTFAQTLVDAGDHDPACVVIDDVHLLDYESLALLGVALGRVAGRNVAFVCSTRSRGRDLDTHASELLSRLAEWPDVEELELTPLASDQVHEVLENLFDKPVSRAVAEAVARQSGGNPLFVLEMARSLSDLDIVDTDSSGVAFSDGPGTLHLTRHTAILRRLFPLPADCRRVAQMVAVLSRIRLTDLELVGELAELNAAEIAKAFDELERRGIIVADSEGTWSLFHQFVADALYDDIGPAERRRLHRRVAEQLVKRRDAGDPVDLMRLAWHVAKSADTGDVDAAGILGEAAESIRSAGPVSAADLCQKALALLPPESSRRAQLLALRTRCLILAGRPREAVDTGLAALDAMSAGGEERTRTATSVIAALFDIGMVDEARALAEREVADGNPSAFLFAQRAMMIAAQGEADLARTAMIRALDMPRRSAGEEVLVRSFLASASMLTGAIAEGLDHLEHLRRVAPAAGTSLHVYGLSRRCWSLVVAGFVADSVLATDEAEAVLGAVGPGTYSAGVAASRIGIDWMRGEWDHALAAIADARREVELSNNAIIRRYLQSIEIDIRTVRGELREALALAQQQIAGGSTTRYVWSMAGTLRATGDDSGARQLLRTTAEKPTDAAWLPHVLLRLLELERDAGNELAVRVLMADLEAISNPSVDPRPWVRALVLRGRALVDADRDAALESAAVADGEGLVYEAALARLEAGIVDPRVTEELLTAHEVFGALGAEADRRRAGSLLRDRGAKVPRRRRRSPGQLTAAETEIARLVQAGLRNREIARTANFSERTVEVYLSRIYTKLGVSSRLQLARYLDEHGLVVDDDQVT
jgi:DNA-binding CsgD family transcriptional regulator